MSSLEAFKVSTAAISHNLAFWINPWHEIERGEVGALNQVKVRRGVRPGGEITKCQVLGFEQLENNRSYVSMAISLPKN